MSRFVKLDALGLPTPPVRWINSD